MRFNSKAAWAASLLSAGFAVATVRADTVVNPSTEYLNRIKVGESIQPLGETPFGENLSLYTGTVGFRQTDISYPGIGPTIVLTRSYEATGSPLSRTNDLAMADWNLSIPRITTLVPGKRMGKTGAWTTNGSNPNARCTQISEITNTPFDEYGLSWWHGYQLVTGDGGSQPILRRGAGNLLAPGNDVAQYSIITPSHWMISCVPSTANGMPGEAFLAVDPNGTRYWFNQLVYGPAVETLVEQIPWPNKPRSSLKTGQQAGPIVSGVYWGIDEIFMPRKTGNMYVTRVEDRFGNSLIYTYNSAGQLTGINASDSRKVLITWRKDSPLVDSITLQPGSPQARVWRYIYKKPTDALKRVLTQVVQPDQTAWSLSMGYSSQLRTFPLDAPCYFREAPQPSIVDAAMTMTHPSGLVGTFDLGRRSHGRSQVPTSCKHSQGLINPPSEHIPSVYLSLALIRKTFSGPGLTSASWTYSYSPAYGSTSNECASGAQCREWSWVEMTDPLNQTTHYTFSTKWGHTDGKLLSTVAGVSNPGQDGPIGLQSDASFYAGPTQGPYPSRLGSTLEESLGVSNNAPVETLSPENLHQSVRQGVMFSRQTTSFDRFGQPENVSRFSSLGAGRSDSTSYWPVVDQWVLGQVFKVTDGATGKVISQTDYDSAMLPIRSYGFGLLKASYAYYANGNMSRIADALGHTTTLSQYYRGVPQRIEFADSTVVAPVADDFGQIAAVRNQLGESTSYTYDAMGRMTSMTYPGADSAAWNPITRGFTPVAVDEYGIPAGHWKQTVRTGTGLSTTFYDAQWRPVLALTEDTGNAASRSFVVKRHDALGREVFSSYPVGSLASVNDTLQGITTAYDALGRVIQVRHDSELGMLSSTTEYLSGFQTRVTNPRGHQTTTSYQVFDAPSTDAPVRIDAPEGVTTTITRDGFGKPTQVTRSGPEG